MSATTIVHNKPTSLTGLERKRQHRYGQSENGFAQTNRHVWPCLQFIKFARLRPGEKRNGKVPIVAAATTCATATSIFRPRRRYPKRWRNTLPAKKACF